MRPLAEDIGVEREQRRQIPAAVADDHRLRNQRMALQLHLDVLWGDILSGGGDDEILLPSGEPQVPVGVQYAQVT